VDEKWMDGEGVVGAKALKQKSCATHIT